MLRYFAAIAAVAALALPVSAHAQAGARITQTVNVYSMPSGGIDAIAKIVPAVGCVTERPITDTYTSTEASADGSFESFYMLALPSGNGWVNARSVTRTEQYVEPVCGTVTGDVKPAGTAAEQRRFKRVLAKLHTLSHRLGRPLHINGGYRTYSEQAALFHSFQAGHGAPANAPGHSQHEIGNAADVEIGTPAQANGGNHSIGSNARAKALAKQLGFKFPHSKEPWHLQL